MEGNGKGVALLILRGAFTLIAHLDEIDLGHQTCRNNAPQDQMAPGRMNADEDPPLGR